MVNQSEQSSRTTGSSSGARGGSAEDPSLRDRAGDAYDSARTTAVEAYDSARERASEAAARAGDGIDEAPLIALAGGLAVGVLLAALLPRTAQEDKLLGPIGEKITGSARNAVEAAKEAGREKMTELNLTRDAGSSAIETLIKGVSEAALGAVKRPA